MTESLRRSIDIRVAQHDFQLAEYVDEDTRLTQVNKTFRDGETSMLANSGELFVTFALGYRRERGSSLKSLAARQGPSVQCLKGMKAGQLGLRIHVLSIDTVTGPPLPLQAARLTLCRRGIELTTGLSPRVSDEERRKAAGAGVDQPEFIFDKFFLLPVTVFMGEDGALEPKAVTLRLEGSPRDGSGVVSLQGELTCNILETVSTTGDETEARFVVSEGGHAWAVKARLQLLHTQGETDEAARDPRCIHQQSAAG